MASEAPRDQMARVPNAGPLKVLLARSAGRNLGVSRYRLPVVTVIQNLKDLSMRRSTASRPCRSFTIATCRHPG